MDQGTESGVTSSKREEIWPIAKLEPDARNARTHDEAQIAQLAQSLQEFGWTTRVLVQRSGKIIAGHGRVLAAHSPASKISRSRSPMAGATRRSAAT